MYLGKDSQVQRFQKINMFPVMFDAMTDPDVTSVTDPFYGDTKVGQVYADAGRTLFGTTNSSVLTTQPLVPIFPHCLMVR